jgi:SAM-dependent methyltransferase
MGMERSQKPDYGIDSPGIVALQLAAGAIAIIGAAALPGRLGPALRWIGWLTGAYFLNGAFGMLHYSRIGKLKLRDHLLNQIRWRGDETVLDVGCGRGLLLAGAARRLTSGKVTGVDVWHTHALSGNRPGAALENAAIEGVAGRVEVERADVRQLPFHDASFDVVVSNFVVHEMKTPADREKMLREMMRVLKPGGQLALIDFIFTRQCVEVLHAAGASNAARLRIGSAGFWCSAVLTLGFFQLYQVTAGKPGGQIVDGRAGLEARAT